jgi:6-pyruvoyltetrahydropterin/6-carboxytetrahydropterin synthase
MFELEKTFRFEAGHLLKHHDGKCKGPHGHSYILGVLIRSETLIAFGPKTNMVLDFAEISAIVKPMIEEYFDHKWLNETLGVDSPSVEFITKWIFDYLHPLLPALQSVTLWETSTSRVTYSK